MTTATKKTEQDSEEFTVGLFEDENRWGFAPHDLVISTFKPRPLIKNEHRQEAVKRGLQDFFDKKTDAELYIRGYAGLDAFPVTSVYFSDGEFLLTSRVTDFGPGYVATNGRYLMTLEEFKKDITNYFTGRIGSLSYDDFKSFITGSELPEKFRKAIRCLLE